MNYRALFLITICIPLYSMLRQKPFLITSVAAAVQADQKEQAARAMELRALQNMCSTPQAHQQEKEKYNDTIVHIIATVPGMPTEIARLVMAYLPGILTTWYVSHCLNGHTKAINNLLRTVKLDEALFSASADGSIKKWDLHTGNQPVDTFSPWGSDGGNVKNIAITPNGTLAVSNTTAGSLALCSTDLLRERCHMDRFVTSMALLSSGKIACVAHTVQERRRNTIIIIDPKDTHLVDPRISPTVKIIPTQYYSIECIAPLSGGGFAIGFMSDVWEELEEGERKREVPKIALLHPDDYDKDDDNDKANELIGHGASIYVLKVLADGRLASGSSDRSIIIWDIPTRSMRKILMGHTASISCIEQLPDRDLISSDFDGNIMIWNIETGLRKHTFKNGKGAVRALAIGIHDTFISAGDDALIKIWKQKPCEVCTRVVMQPTEQDAPRDKKTSKGKSSCCIVM